MKVYKYRSTQTSLFERDKKSLLLNQFFAPTFDMLNDQFEANFGETISQVTNLLKNMSLVGNDQQVKDCLHDIVALKDQLGIFSLSKNFLNEQMWAYYADSNMGYCIEYELDKLKDRSRNLDFAVQLDVMYDDKRPILHVQDIRKESLLQKMLGIKKMGWKHEEELRLIFDNSAAKQYHESAVTGIYFGCKASESSMESLKEIFCDRDVSFYQIKKDLNAHKFGFEQFFQSTKPKKYNLGKYSFELLKHEDNLHIENYYVYLKSTLNADGIKDFVQAFRESVTYKPANINFFNSSAITHLIGIYPLPPKDYIQYANAFIAVSDYGSEEAIFEFPYKDYKYQEYLGIQN